MKKQTDVLKALDPAYFWDVDYGKLDAQDSKRLIIDRVFSLGNLEEISLLINLYGEKQIIDTLSRLNYLDPKTLNFVSKLFNISKEKFRCYTKAQLTRQHWNS
jgi:hypothetical protein